MCSSAFVSWYEKSVYMYHAVFMYVHMLQKTFTINSTCTNSAQTASAFVV